MAFAVLRVILQKWKAMKDQNCQEVTSKILKQKLFLK